MNLAARTREIALTLAGWPSVTGTQGEAEFANRLESYLRESRAETVWRKPIDGDELGRSNVFALKKGKSPRTIVLAGHFDVVPVEDYGELKPLAFSPLRLRERMIARLEKSGENALALGDLQSGDFLPGRGLLDMKAGLAAGIAAMEAYDGQGSVLLVATPDEEDRSAGMRAAAQQLPRLAKEHDLDIALIINLDSISDQGDGRFGQSVAFGSIGKLLLTALVVGTAAHACYPFDGVNAAYLASQLVSEFECAPELAEATGPEMAAPPTALHAKDLKSGYNVTTPGAAWAYWNTLQHRGSASGVLATALSLARRAMARAGATLAERAAALGGKSIASAEIPVLTYSELVSSLGRTELDALASSLARRHDVDLPERCRMMTEFVWSRSGRSGPGVVLGFGSIPYPAVSLDDDELERRIGLAMSEINGDIGVPVGAIRYFPGISDMSFLGRSRGGLAASAANTPIWGTSFTLEPSPNYPVINIGPWGRDYHHWLERLHAPYAFDVLPRLLLNVAVRVVDCD